MLIYRLDRLARRTHLAYTLLQELMEAGVGVRSYSEPQIDSTTPMGKVSLGVTAIFAELERDTFMQRSRDGRRKAVTEGIHGGGPVPYGYVLQNHRLAVHEPDAAVIRMIFSWYTEHHWSTVRITRELAALNILSRYRATNRRLNGKITDAHWKSGSIRLILKNRIYIGEHQYGRRNSKGRNPSENVLTVQVPAIVDRDMWEGAQQKMLINSRTAQRNAKRAYMLRGLIRCDSCGRSYAGHTGRREGLFRYRCGGRSHRIDLESPICTSPTLDGVHLEAQLWQRITEILSAPDEALAQQPMTIVPAELPMVEKALADIQVSQERLTDLYLDAHGSMSKQSYLTRLAAFEEQRAGLQARLLVLRDTEAHQQEQKRLERRIHDLSAQYWDQLAQPDDELRQVLANQLIEHVTVQADGSIDVKWVV
ncbi:hypothetical protein ASF71_19605 [Deinococcus sp. Leaf326]|nr:hypothetical protein ASF71_19605 [Deinococcus sp. Leaf326]